MRKPNAASVYLIIRAAMAFCMATAFTTSSVYRFQSAGLSPLQLILVGTTLEVSVFLFEIPTGIVADLYSRRRSLLIGYTLIGVGIFFEGVFPLFAAILLAQVLWGLGYTFTSGALDAWLGDEVGETQLAASYLRGAQAAQVAGLAGIVAGTTLASLRLNLPFLAAGTGILLLALYLYGVLPETGFAPASQAARSTWRSMAATFLQGWRVIRSHPRLPTILAIVLIGGLASEGLDRLWEAHLLQNHRLPPLAGLDPIFWFGAINLATTLLTLGLTEVLRRRAARFSHLRAVWILIVLNAVLIGGLLIFGLSQRFAVAVIAFIALSVARSTMDPIFSTWVNRDIESRVRATVLSTIGQMDAIGQVVGGPPMGAFAARYGLRLAMAAIGLIFAPTLALYARLLVRDQADPSAAEPMA